MPIVPRSTGPRVEDAPLALGQERAPDTRFSGVQQVAQGLDSVGDGLDRFARVQDSQAAFAADTAVKTQWLQADAQLRQKYRGANAAGYAEEVTKFWDDARKTQGEALNQRAQRLIGQSLMAAQLHATANATNYVTQETERAQDVAFTASQEAEVQRAAASGDPAVAAVSQGLLKRRNAEQAAIRGWSPELLDQQNMKATTALHVNMIQDLQQKDPKAALDYFNANKADIDGTRHAEIGHTLDNLSASSEGLQTASEVWDKLGPKQFNQPIDLTSMEAEVRKKYANDKPRLDAAMSSLKERKAAFNSSETEANAGNVNTVMGAFAAGTTSIAQIQRMPAFQALPGKEQAQIIEHVDNRLNALASRAAALSARADSEESRAQRRLERNGTAEYLRLSDPAVLSTMTEAQVQAQLPVLGNELTKHLTEKFRSTKSDPAKASMDQDDFNHYAEQLGLKPFAKKSDDEKAALGEMKYRVEQVIADAQKVKGKSLTREEQGALMQVEMARTVKTGGFFGFGQSDTPVIALTKDQVGSVSVPDKDRAQIVDALKAAYQRNPSNPEYAPTDANVRRLYLRNKSRSAAFLPNGN